MTLAVDIGSAAVKAVRLRRTLGGWSLVGACRRAIPRAPEPDAKAALARALKDALVNGEIPRSAVVGITGRDVHLQVLLYARTSARDYASLLRFELEQRRQTAPDDILAHATLCRPGAPLPHFLELFAAARPEPVARDMDLLDRIGIRATDIIPNAIALAHLHRHGYGAEPGTVLLLDVGADGMEFVLMREGHPIFVRNLTVGARLFDEHIRGMLQCTLEEAETHKVRRATLGEAKEGSPEAELMPVVRTAAGQWKAMIDSTLNFARTQLQERSLAADKIYLSGGGARLRGLVEYVASAMRLPVEPLDPFRRIDARVVREQAPDPIGRMPSDLAVATGLALAGSALAEAPVVSLVPASVQRARRWKRQGIPLVAALALLVLSMAYATFSAWGWRSAERSAWDREKADLDGARGRIGRMELLTEDRAALGRMRGLREYVDPGRVLLEGLRRLRATIPDGLALREIELVERPEGAQVRRVVRFTGDVSEGIEGGTTEALDRVLEALNDPALGVVARRERYERNPDQPGWRTFVLELALAAEER